MPPAASLLTIDGMCGVCECEDCSGCFSETLLYAIHVYYSTFGHSWTDLVDFGCVLYCVVYLEKFSRFSFDFVVSSKVQLIVHSQQSP